jgi:integrase
MARMTKRLTVKKVASLVKKIPLVKSGPRKGQPTTRLYCDGDGLNLQVTPTLAASWLYRYTGADGRPRSIGLGPQRKVTLDDARDATVDADRLARGGTDPLASKRASKLANAATAHAITFQAYATGYIKDKALDKQWLNSLTNHAFPKIGAKPVKDITVDDVAGILQPIWTAKHVTATRIQTRLESIMDAARAAEHYTHENPASWNLVKHRLPEIKRTRKNHAAPEYQTMPAYVAKLRFRTAAMVDWKASAASRALEFAIMCVARTKEVRLAKWCEIDVAAKCWTVPAARMKARKEHFVPLSSAALAAIGPAGAPDAFVFTEDTAPLAPSALLETLRLDHDNTATVHGICRATFRTWASSEETGAENETIEFALAHTHGDRSEQAYERGTRFAKRVKLMDQWAAYLAS